MPKQSKEGRKTFGERFNDAMTAIQHQRQADRDLFVRVFDALDQYEGRHKLRHQVTKLTDTSGDLTVDDTRVAEFTAKAGKVIIKGETLEEDAAVTRLAELMAETVTAIDDDKRSRRPQAQAADFGPPQRRGSSKPLYPA